MIAKTLNQPRLVSRYDGHEKTWSEPMPFLFQRQLGTVRGVISPATVLNMIGRSCEEIAEANPPSPAPSSPRTTSEGLSLLSFRVAIGFN